MAITALINNSPEIITIPRYLLEKHSSIFKEELKYHDITDPSKKQQTIPLSLSSWYNRHRIGPNQRQSELDILRDWNMLTIFCKWTLCGRVIGKPMVHPKDVPWGSKADPLCMADIAYWILEDTQRRKQSQATVSK